MIRRVHIEKLRVGRIQLSEDQAHHLRDVLRLTVGERVEAFDDAGLTAPATVVQADSAGVVIEATAPHTTKPRRVLTIASAIPKGERADWMIEKLSEIGVDRFIPLACARSVVLPRGANKADRWARIAVESAKQSRRGGVMQIEPLVDLGAFMGSIRLPGIFLSTTDAPRLLDQTRDNTSESLTLLIGPEGGWTPEELHRMSAAGMSSARLTDTILRVETAAILAAAIARVSE
jgi:16S rRNA (uracil1498-N3)-methyltransferase